MIVLLSVPESWFALQVAPRHEKKVAYLLEYKGHESFVPTSRVRRNWSDRVKSIDQPIFPGYVFCRIQKTGSGLVLATPGVVRVVSFGGKPSPVSNEEIEALQRISHAGGEVSPYPYTRIGQKVQITRGVFTGVIGVIVQVRNQHRLVVNVDTIMKAISITIDASEVAPVPGNSVVVPQFAATA